jgi:hypothetical protein
MQYSLSVSVDVGINRLSMQKIKIKNKVQVIINESRLQPILCNLVMNWENSSHKRSYPSI